MLRPDSDLVCRPKRLSASLSSAVEKASVCLTLLALSMSCLGADKSGVSPTTVSLPKGPGSIEGLGESFQPTLNTGTAKYAVKLTFPPGTAGHAPHMALQYEGGGGNGPLGFGWSLPMSSIQRRCDKGIPTYGEDVGFPRQDTFINDAKEELVPIANGFFFSKNEGAFIRYQQVGDHWEGTMPDGTRLEFGLSDSGRVQDGPNRVFSWLLERETDTRRNTIVYSYSAFPGDRNSNQKYLSAIRYGPGAPPWTNFHFVMFQYEQRPDWFEDCRSGFAVRTGQRLKSIVIGTQGPTLANHLRGDFDGDGTPDNLVRRYDLDYAKYAGDDSHWSLLAKITQVGADGVATLPPASFTHQICNPPDLLDASGHVIGGENVPPFVMDNPLVDLVDLNGDGLPDILKTDEGGGFHTAYLNEGEINAGGARAIRWGAGQLMAAEEAQRFNLQSDQSAGDHSAHLADMDGDGIADFVVKASADNVFYFANRSRAAWGPRQQMSIQDVAPPAPFGTLGVRTADLDFDKRIDVIRSLGDGLGYQIWFNLDGSNYSSRILGVSKTGFSFDFTQPGVQIADLNGDRVPDVARVWPTGITITAGLGYGRFGSPIEVPLPGGIVLTEQQIARAKLVDITGDGPADLVIERAEGTDLWYWINLGTYTFSGRKRITGLPAPIGLKAEIRWADLNGNGTTDYVFADRESSPSIQTVDLGELIACGSTPNLLTTISNGIGRVTLISYQPSTKFAIEDAAVGRPWPDVMPFPVTVVSAVTNLDSLGHAYATRFRYHDAYYDPVEKQFRGFARVEQVDVGDASAPTLITRSYFDTGRQFEPMKGRLLRLIAEQEDGRVFTDETNSWVTPPVTLMTGTNGTNVVFVHPVASVKLIKELGQGEERRLESEMSFDNFGNQTRNANYGIVVNGDRSAFNDERITTTEYAINTNTWILRAPTRVEIKDEQGAVISRAEMFYDDESFSGNNFGLVTRGELTLKREWKDPTDPSGFVNSARTKYDTYGNPIIMLDPLASAPNGVMDFSQGHARQIDYDPRFHTLPVTETIHVGNGSAPLVFQASYDEGFGTVSSSTDFNANITSYGYDVFARLTNIVKPGDTPASPTVEYDYALAVRFPRPVGQGEGINEGVVNFVETRQLDQSEIRNPKSEMYLRSRQFVDGLGRNLLIKQEAEPAPGSTTPRVVVTGATQFNARQKPARVINPYFSLSNARPADGRGTGAEGLLDDLLAFENIEAPGWQGQFHHEGALVTLNLTDAPAISTAYDATLRPIQVTNPDGTFSRTVYEPLLTRSFDENDTDPASPFHDTPMAHFNDGLGRLIRADEVVRLKDDGTPSSELQSWTTRYNYDLNDQLTHITDSQENEKEFRYDGLKRKTFMNDPDRGEMRFVYDDASNLIETTDAKGQRITYTYDGANRIRTEKYHDGKGAPPWHPVASIGGEAQDEGETNSVVYHYDSPVANLTQGDNTEATARNVKGALAWVEDLSGEEHTSYDSRGRVEWVVKRIPDVGGNQAPGIRSQNYLVSYPTGFAYDSLDRLTLLTYPDADQLRYEYNNRNLLERIPGGAVSGLTKTGAIISDLAYAPSGQMTQIHYGNGVHTGYKYDPRLRLTRLSTIAPPKDAGQTEGLSWIDFSYDFDGVSNIKSITDLRPGSAVPERDPRRNTQLFQYDDLYRLTRVQYSFALPGAASHNDGEINYRYDRIGNMLAQTSDIAHFEKGLSVTDLGAMESGGTAGRFARIGRKAGDPPGPHALTSIQNPNSQIQNRKYDYDANGNMTNIDGLVCTWDFKDRLVGVENSEMRAAYIYDYTDRRITKHVAWKQGYPRSSGTNSLPTSGGEGRGEVVTVSYINKYFEVREHDAPTKYVWNGNTRVAHVTGSLNSNVRVQRLRIYPGWNLCSFAVTATNALSQFSAFSLQPSAFRWDQPTLAWLPVATNETLAAGKVLWLRASTNATVSLMGTYSPPVNAALPIGPSFQPGAGLEAWDLKSSISNSPSLDVWTFDASRTWWLPLLPSLLQPRADLAVSIVPGQALFARTDAPAQLELPESALRIRYYHQDHLGSSSVLTDAFGNFVEESANHAFGSPRNTFRARPACEAYRFTQKENDSESDLLYFELRFLLSRFGRFVSVDPLGNAPPEAWSGSPQKLNLYAYAQNCPIMLIDADGTDEQVAYVAYSLVGGAYARNAIGARGYIVCVNGGAFTAARAGRGLATMRGGGVNQPLVSVYGCAASGF